MSELILKIARAAIEIGGWVARYAYLNWNTPRVGRIVRDLPYGPDPRNLLDVIVPPAEHGGKAEGQGPKAKGEAPDPVSSSAASSGAASASSVVPDSSSLKPQACRPAVPEAWSLKPQACLKPVVLNAHGGAMMALSKEIATPLCCELARAGVLVVNLTYRLAPRHRFPAAMEDMALALAWTREHVTEYGGDPDNIFLAGQSAGSLVAAWLGVALAKPELFDETGIDTGVGLDGVRGMLLFYGVYDLETVTRTRFPLVELLPRAMLGNHAADRSRRLALASPKRHVTPRTPAAFLCCGEADPLFPQSREMHEAMLAAGTAHRALFFPRHRHPEAGHAFVQFPARRCGRMALARAVEFMNDRRRSPSPGGRGDETTENPHAEETEDPQGPRRDGED